MGREKFADLRDLCGRQPRQHLGEIFLRVQAAPPATDQDRIDHCAAPSGLGVADEEPSLATDRRRAEVILHPGMPTSGLCRAISPPMGSERVSAALIVADAA